MVAVDSTIQILLAYLTLEMSSGHDEMMTALLFVTSRQHGSVKKGHMLSGPFDPMLASGTKGSELDELISTGDWAGRWT